jgi:ABC-type multidrug transport system fused ATPase/permease subunit
MLSLNRTSLIISNRLDNVVDSDEILVIKNGSIVEQGTHTQLMSLRDGLFYSMTNPSSITN